MGCGNNAASAIEDALEMIADNGWDITDMEARILKRLGKRKMPTKPQVRDDDNDREYYVSIRVK